jgi:hypothetical protein
VVNGTTFSYLTKIREYIMQLYDSLFSWQLRLDGVMFYPIGRGAFGWRDLSRKMGSLRW